MWEASKTTPFIQHMWVLKEENGEKEDSKRLVIGGCLLLLRRKVQIPRGEKSFILWDADGGDDDANGGDDEVSQNDAS